MTVAELAAKLSLKIDQASFEAADKLLGAVKAALLGLSAIKLGQWVNGIVQSVVTLGGSLDDLSNKTGINVQTLQELGYAAQQNGSSLEAMGSQLKRLSKNAGEVAKGKGDMAKAFRKAGIDVKDSVTKKMLPADAILAQIADHIQGLSEAERPIAAMKLLGKGGEQLVPMLKDGAAGLARYREEARELGGVIGKDGVSALDEFGDAQDKVKFSIQGLKNDAVLALMPVLQDMINSTIKWIKANRKLLIERITYAVKALIWVLKLIGKTINTVVGAIKWLDDNSTVLIATLGALAAAFIVVKRRAVMAFLASKAAAVVAMGWIAALAAAFILAALVIEDFYFWITDGESLLGEFLGSWEDALADDGLLGIFANSVKMIKDTVVGLIDAIKALFKGDLGGFFKAIGTWLVNNFINGFKNLGRLALGVLKGLGVIFKAAFEAIYDVIAAAFSAIADFFASVGHAIADAFRAAFDAVIGGIKAAIDWIVSKLEWAWDKAKQVKNFVMGNAQSESFQNWMKSVGGGLDVGMLGGLSSGVAPAARSTENTANAVSVQAPVTLTIQAPPGANAQEFADTARDAIQKFWDEQMRVIASINGGQ